jgi:NAD(P)-dependent dehydrogenase (short-subunit alcohol dehydrogenase family)
MSSTRDRKYRPSGSSVRPRRILCTGVGGSIGSAIEDRLRARGDDLLLLGHAGHAGRADLVVDFSSPAELEGTIGRISGEFDGAVFSHGMLRPGPLSRATPAEWREVLDANLNSIYTILHGIQNKLRSGSSVVVISSTAALGHSPVGGPHYTASKWGLNGLVRHLVGEFGSRGIRINSVCPGLVDNPMGRAFLSDEQVEEAIKAIPMRRAGRPAEIASVVDFLLGDDASYVSGAFIPVSGGFQ